MTSPFIPTNQSEEFERYVDSLETAADPFEILSALEEEYEVPIIHLIVNLTTNH